MQVGLWPIGKINCTFDPKSDTDVLCLLSRLPSWLPYMHHASPVPGGFQTARRTTERGGPASHAPQTHCSPGVEALNVTLPEEAVRVNRRRTGTPKPPQVSAEADGTEGPGTRGWSG